MYSLPLHHYLGLGLLYAAVGTTALAGLGAAGGVRSIGRAIPTIFAVLFFVALTQHPLPDPELLALRCFFDAAEPRLLPFGFVRDLIDAWRWDVTWARFLRYGPVLPTLMNLGMCVLIGGLLARHSIQMRTGVLMGFGLSLSIELTQLTGVWGLYACAYRKFDADDLILNTLGAAIGFAAVARQQRS